MRWRLLLLLLAVGVPRLHAAPCGALVQRALARYEARAAYASVVQAAQQARACAGIATPPEVFAAEAWGLVNEERWDDLRTLWAHHRRAFPHPSQVPLAVRARVESAVGVAFVVGGQAREGLAMQRRLLALLPSTRPLLHASTLSALAWSHTLTGDYGEAESAYARMERVVERHLYGPARRPMQLRARSERAGNLLAWHESDPRAPASMPLALRLAREAIPLARAEEDPSSEAIARLFEGEALHYLGRLDESRRALQHVQRLPDATYWPYAEWDLARLAARTQRDAEALTRYERAHAALSDDPSDLRDLLYEIGALHERAERWGESEAAYHAAIAALDRLLVTAGTDDSWLRTQQVWQRPYRGLARVLARTGRPAEALALLDAAQARYLDLYRSRAALQEEPTGTVGALLAAQEATRDRLAGPLPHAGRLQLEARLDSLGAVLAARTALPRRRTWALAELQTHLRREGQALVAFLLDAPEAFAERPLASFAIVATPDTVLARPLPMHADTLGWWARQISPALSPTGTSSLQALQFNPSALEEVFAATLGPVWETVRPFHRLVVVPDGPLFRVPLAALRLPEGQTLVDQQAVSVELAPSLLLTPISRQERARVLVAARSRFRRGEATPLPNVRREVRAIAEAVRADVLLDASAQESRVRQQARAAHVLHLATHTDLSAASPLYYALRLRPDAHEDGLWRLHELQSLHLPVRLAVLSGCATAQGELHAGEGMAGLQYGIRAAGAQSVVATLWLVDDAAMAELMGAFYRALAQGQPSDVALQQAQQQYRARHPRASPFFWAAPALYGAAQRVALEPAPWYGRRAVRFGGIGGLALVLVLAGVVALRKRLRHAR